MIKCLTAVAMATALHVFQKKSKKGIQTPKAEIELVKARLKLARDHYKEHYEN